MTLSTPAKKYWALYGRALGPAVIRVWEIGRNYSFVFFSQFMSLSQVLEERREAISVESRKGECGTTAVAQCSFVSSLWENLKCH